MSDFPRGSSMSDWFYGGDSFIRIGGAWVRVSRIESIREIEDDGHTVVTTFRGAEHIHVGSAKDILNKITDGPA